MGAIGMGPESVPHQSDISFENGLLVARRPDEHATGVALLWDMGPHGSFPARNDPAAAARKTICAECGNWLAFALMKVMQKQEDWNLFDFPRAERFGIKFREAQDLLAQALGMLHEPSEAAKLADHALIIGVELSEELCIFHAELLIQRRRGNGAFVKHVVGCRIDTAVQNEKYREMLFGNFDYAVVPMSWRQLEPEEHKFETAAVDEWVEALSKKRMPIIAGPLVQLDEANLPDWMFIWEHDFDSIRELAYEYVQRTVQRYRKAISMWNVVAGLNTNGAFSLSFEQTIELTRLLVSQVKALLPSTRTLITVTQPFGEYHAKKAASVPPMMYAEMVAQAGINFEAFGVEIEIGVPSTGRFTRDLFQLSCMLDKFSAVGRPLFITAIGVPGRNNCDPDDKSDGRLDPSLAGRWRRGWIRSCRLSGWKRFIIWPSASHTSKVWRGRIWPTSTPVCRAVDCWMTCCVPSPRLKSCRKCEQSFIPGMAVRALRQRQPELPCKPVS